MSGIMTPASTSASLLDAENAPPPPTEGEHSFRDARVAFAVDVSGSTHGSTLLAEQNFIKSIAQQLSPHARLQARILPWSHSASRIMSLSNVTALHSGGGTTPSVIVADSNHRRTLAQSSVWFLMTDGLINTTERLRFARMLAEKGVHGTSCVVVIFEGQIGSGWSGNISVGVSVFAVVPNCAFILYDLRTDVMRILQAKGLFRCLLGGREPPDLDAKADLTTFPSVTPNDFCDVVARMPQKLDADQIALQDSQAVNMDDLFANRLGEAEVNNILSNEDNLASVIMTSQSRGQTRQFQGWVQQQQQQCQAAAHTPTEVEDVGGAAGAAFTEIMQSQQQGQSPSGAVQTRLRLAHAANMAQLEKNFRKKMVLAMQRDILFNQAKARSNTTIDSVHSLRRTSAYATREATRTVPAPAGFSNPPNISPGMSSMRPATMPTTRPAMPRLAAPFELENKAEGSTSFRPGDGSFVETCPLCLTENVTLSLLFRRPRVLSHDMSYTMNASNQSTSLQMGGSNQLDILSSTICCDPCSRLCVKLATSADPKEVIYASLPLVPWAHNGEAFRQALPIIFGAHMAAHNQEELLVSVVLTALGRPDLPAVFRAALTWSAKDLLQSVHSTWGAPGKSEPSQPLAAIMHRSLTSSGGTLLMGCHVHAFVLTLRGAGLLGTSLELRRSAALKRLIFSVCQNLVLHWQMRRLMTREDRLKVAQLLLRSFLWEQSADSGATTRQVLSISPTVLDQKGLMMRGQFATLQKADELSGLLGPSHAMALLLHSLYRIISQKDAPDDRLQIFDMLEADSGVQRALQQPDQITEADVAAVAV